MASQFYARVGKISKRPVFLTKEVLIPMEQIVSSSPIEIVNPDDCFITNK